MDNFQITFFQIAPGGAGARATDTKPIPPEDQKHRTDSHDPKPKPTDTPKVPWEVAVKSSCQAGEGTTRRKLKRRVYCTVFPEKTFKNRVYCTVAPGKLLENRRYCTVFPEKLKDECIVTFFRTNLKKSSVLVRFPGKSRKNRALGRFPGKMRKKTCIVPFSRKHRFLQQSMFKNEN